jgi:hypothetical protein
MVGFYETKPILRGGTFCTTDKKNLLSQAGFGQKLVMIAVTTSFPRGVVNAAWVGDLAREWLVDLT